MNGRGGRGGWGRRVLGAGSRGTPFHRAWTAMAPCMCCRKLRTFSGRSSVLTSVLVLTLSMKLRTDRRKRTMDPRPNTPKPGSCRCGALSSCKLTAIYNNCGSSGFHFLQCITQVWVRNMRCRRPWPSAPSAFFSGKPRQAPPDPQGYTHRDAHRQTHRLPQVVVLLQDSCW